MKAIKRILSVIALISSCAMAQAGMVAITIGQTEEEAIQSHKQAGAKVQTLKVQDKNYPMVIRATYRDQSATFIVTDAIEKRSDVVVRQAVVSRDSEALRSLGTWFNKQSDYKIVEDDKWKTEKDGDNIVVYFEPVANYKEGIIIEKERFK